VAGRVGRPLAPSSCRTEAVLAVDCSRSTAWQGM
jgi:hypothetical protein